MNNIRYPFDWQKVSLEDICCINRYSLTEKTSKDYKFQYIDLSSVNKGKITFSNQYMFFKDAPCRARRIIHQNDIIISTVRPNLKVFAFIDFNATDFICSTGFAVLTAKENVSNKYVYQLLYSKEIETQINNMLVGSNYPAINSSDVASLKIFLPPLPEQEKIAGILGTWDEAIEKLSDLIEQKKVLKKGLMQKLLTGKTRLSGFTQPWREVKLGEICKLETANSKSSLIIENGKYCVIDMGAVSSEAALISTKKTNSNEDLLDVNDVVMPKDDIGGGNIIGKTAIIKQDNTYVLSDHVFKLKIHKANPTFISYLINSYQYNKYMRRMSCGSAILGLSKKDVEKCLLYIPDDISEQQAIADVLSTADNEINLLNQKLEALKAQKKGLMQKLLTGQIRVKVN